MTLPSNGLSRRQFLLGASTILAAPTFIPSHLLGRAGKSGPNSRIAIGVIGIGIRGKYQIANIPPEGKVVAVCDWYIPQMDFLLAKENSSRYASLLNRFREEDAKAVTKYQDYRKMIESAKLDAIMITACDHHHVQAAVLACQAGLDVYVEKPVSVTIGEGRVLVNAAKKYKRVVQVGSQQRTMEMNQFACQFVREGKLGKIKRITLRNLPGPLRYEDEKDNLPKEEVPKGGDWDLYCGPTPLRAYNLKLWAKEEFAGERFAWRGWDMWQDYSGHYMSNHGAHSIDMAQLALGMDHTGPVEIIPLMENFKGEMRTCPILMKYANGVELAFEGRGAIQKGEQFRGDPYVGEKGTLLMRRNGFTVDPPELVQNPPDKSVLEKWTGSGENVSRPHIQNWLDCIKTRGTPNAPIEAGHRTATICHLANLARQLKRKLRWDPEKEEFVGDEEANALRERPRRKGWELPKIS